MSDIEEAKSGPKPPPAPRAPPHALLEGCVAEFVVSRALLGILQGFVSLVQFLEAGFRALVAGIAVGVAFLRLTTEGALELLLIGSALDTQDFVKVSLGHRGILSGYAKSARDVLERSD